MPTLPRPDRAGRIAAVELRRALRGLAGRNAVQLAALGVAVLFGLAVTAGAAVGAYLAGRRLAAGAVADPFAVATLVAAGLAVFVLSTTAYVTVLQTGDIDNREGLLTTVPHRDLAGGLLLAGFFRTVGPFLPSLAVAAAAFGVGAGSAATLALAVVAVLAVVAAAYTAGFAVGLAVKYLLGRSETVARHKVALGAAAFLGYMALLVTDTLGAVVVSVVDALGDSPVGWYADLALLAAEPAASPLRAGAAVAGSGAVVLAGVVAAVRVAGRLWYADPVVAERRAESAAPEGRLDGVLGRPTAWVARKSWLRTRRAPVKLVYVAYPLFLLFGQLQASVEAGRAVGTLPATLALYGAWATGAAFTLNPLGDEGAVLPVTLTTGVGGTAFVRGRLLAGALPGLPVTVAATAVAGGLSALPPAAVVATVAAAAVLPLCAAGLAAGVGTAFPKFETTQIVRSREAVVPSIWAFGAYSLAVFLLGAPATAAQVPAVTAAAAGAAGVPPVAVRAAGLAVSTALVAAAGYASYRYAVRTVDAYAME